MAKKKGERYYTVFCRESSGAGTVWVQALSARSAKEAASLGHLRCAEAWDYPLELVEVVGVAAGVVKILYWNDKN